jgi:hypothetical protein
MASSLPPSLAPIQTWRRDSDRVEALAARVSRALADGDLDAASPAFAEYRDLILAHLANEEDVSFPAAERLAPAQGGPIRSLRVAHIGIREDLARVAEHLASGHGGAAKAVFFAFLETFAAHERLEDQLVALLSDSS